MVVSRFDPAQELLRLHDRINRLFQLSSQGDIEEDQLITGAWTPACDILETKDALILRAELPGVKRSDIDISLDQGLLTIRGNREPEKESEERTFHRIERSYGQFSRSFTLPRTIDPEQISAGFTDGILEIKMPKREEGRPRQIRINVEPE